MAEPLDKDTTTSVDRWDADRAARAMEIADEPLDPPSGTNRVRITPRTAAAFFFVAGAGVLISVICQDSGHVGLGHASISGSGASEGLSAHGTSIGASMKFPQPAAALTFALGLVPCPVLGASEVVMWGPDQKADCAGANTCGSIGPVPALPADPRSISAGSWNSAAVLADGRVVCWGWGEFGVTVPPADLPSIREVAVGGIWNGGFCAAIDFGDGIHCWGRNLEGQCNAPGDLGRVSHVACGGHHTIALGVDGSVRCWGLNDSGQTSVPSDLGPVRAVSGGWLSTAVICTDGTVRCWGANGFGQCNVPSGLVSIIGIDSGDVHVVAVRADGTVSCWGWNDHGQCNVPLGLTGVVRASAGWGHTVALRHDGSVVQWGANDYNEFKNLPVGPSRITAIDAGYFHTVAIVNPPCTGDIFQDGLVNGADLGALLSYWGPVTSAPASALCDLDHDGIVGGGDLGILLANWGPCGG
jgi:Regulator of chromosome condensation (RCC1) repeat